MEQRTGWRRGQGGAKNRVEAEDSVKAEERWSRGQGGGRGQGGAEDRAEQRTGWRQDRLDLRESSLRPLH